MSIEDGQSYHATFALRPSARAEVAAEAEAAKADPRLLDGFRELIRSVLATPAHNTDPEIVALLRGARKMHKNFQISLALRALRLEQGLRAAQQEIIRLQWELAHLRPRAASSLATEAEDY
jgi:hypothetical protein